MCAAMMFLTITYAHYLPPLSQVLRTSCFVQAYGMMGWRVGYLAFPEDGSGKLAAELVKVQVGGCLHAHRD